MSLAHLLYCDPIMYVQRAHLQFGWLFLDASEPYLSVCAPWKSEEPQCRDFRKYIHITYIHVSRTIFIFTLQKTRYVSNILLSAIFLGAIRHDHHLVTWQYDNTRGSRLSPFSSGRSVSRSDSAVLSTSEGLTLQAKSYNTTPKFRFIANLQ